MGFNSGFKGLITVLVVWSCLAFNKSIPVDMLDIGYLLVLNTCTNNSCSFVVELTVYIRLRQQHEIQMSEMRC